MEHLVPFGLDNMLDCPVKHLQLVRLPFVDHHVDNVGFGQHVQQTVLFTGLNNKKPHDIKMM